MHTFIRVCNKPRVLTCPSAKCISLSALCNQQRSLQPCTGSYKKQSSQNSSNRRISLVCRGAAAASSPSGDYPVKLVGGKIKRLLHSRHDADIFELALPALFSILLDPIMSLTDTALVGRLGSAELAAVGLSGIAFAFASVVFNFLLFITTPSVAAAIAQEDREKASSVTAQGLWVALFAGILLAMFIWWSSPFVVGRLLGAGPEVTVHAVTYLQCRSVACPALLGMYVATGSFRGHKDTRTPLFASIISNFINFGLDLFLMFVLGWGVAGAAIATSVSQYVSFFILYWRLRATKMLLATHIREAPSKETVKPFLQVFSIFSMAQSGLALSLRSVIVMGTYVFATSLISSLGSITLAASEILRQVFILSMQSFTALDISSQALVASYLGRGNRAMARDVLFRAMQLGIAVGIIIGSIILATRYAIPSLFSSDPEVQAIASSTLPVLALMMPVDAMAAVMDGGLLGASETSWVSRASVAISGIVLVALVAVKQIFPKSLIALWVAMKMMSIGRVISGTIRYSSRGSKLSPQR